jgi:hypothetical protein
MVYMLEANASAKRLKPNKLHTTLKLGDSGRATPEIFSAESCHIDMFGVFLAMTDYCERK